jgi:hypothetical protein
LRHGDFNPSFFFVNQVNPKLMIGVGPTFLLPTSTDRRLRPDGRPFQLE